MRGEGRRLSGASICLLARWEGWPTPSHDAAAPARGGGDSANRDSGCGPKEKKGLKRMIG
jgi:hypothetical protein